MNDETMDEPAETSIGRLKEIDLLVALHKLTENDLIFHCDFNQISKHFLSAFLNVNPFSVNFMTLRQAYIKSASDVMSLKDVAKLTTTRLPEELERLFEQKHSVPKSEMDFHKYICMKYINLVKEPGKELLDNYIKATEDLRIIDQTLTDIKNQVTEIEGRNQATEIQDKKPVLYYYKILNERAKEEILNFLKHEVKGYALTNSYDSSLLGMILSGRVPYTYRWNPNSYKPRYPDDLENKFRDLAIEHCAEISRVYREDKPAFYIFLKRYIETNEIVDSVRNLINEHHLLDVRKEIILEALQIYEHGSKIMFANSVPTIIEGIFHDLCIVIGEDENELLKEGFQYKLNKLEPVLTWELYYEYYAFRFRLFRNKVAHGRLKKNDVDELGDLLLLDLYHVCKMVFSNKLKFNQKRFIINELFKNLEKPDHHSLNAYLLLNKIQIPDFYKLNSQIKEVEKLIMGNGFWKFLETEIESGSDESKHGIYQIAKIISNREPFDKRCTSLFKKLGIKSLNAELAKAYFKQNSKSY